jgi:hypothetical protein
MSLTFPDGEPFTSAVTTYRYRPATERETVSRIILDVQIEGITTAAMVDTGGLYFLCNPRVATLLRLDTAEAMSGLRSILFRGVSIQGRLYRLNLTLFADEGEDFTFETTAFVPEEREEESWGELPCVLGFHGCLERLRFAVDPQTEMFYFGSTSGH